MQKFFSQTGFTLIELMIVLAIISILAIIAIPKYQNYVAKARFSEIIQAIIPYKLEVATCLMSLGSTEGCNANENGIGPNLTNAGSIKSITVENGRITALGQKPAPDDSYILQANNKNNMITWQVSGTCKIHGTC